MISGEKLTKVFKGTIIHSIHIHQVELLQNHYIGVSDSGVILFLSDDDKTVQEHLDSHQFQRSDIVDLGRKFIIPGYIDTHAHAPQYHNAGTGTDLPLLKWLEKYTFPVESKFRDLEFAEHVYSKVVDRMLRNGTTTCCYYATIHLDASKLLADIVSRRGQRGFIGKVCMDRHSPDHYIETTDESISNTKEFIRVILEANNPLVQPIITPRFAPSCTNTLMTALGDLAKQHNKVLIQSHLSENLDEIQWVKSLYPDIPTYTHVYHHFGLLNERTIMAHAIHLSEDELKLLKQTQSSISHCPVSNFTLTSGNMDIRKVIQHDIKLALGTDISGGFSPSILQVMRDSIKCSNSCSFVDSAHKALSYEEAFYLATVGGSKVVNMEHKLGNLLPGKEFDAQIIDPFAPNSPFDVFAGDSLKDIFQKYIFLGDDRNISQLYVKGTKINFN
ncbi:guanine deaminase [Tieghemostelium lacteum]|uniref:Guanine deaminase n=1 Tax=Tieghemostelium lacteum TaxID=361077 RepID=A0A151Z2S5_TIELA|nr:guanine deaminase [Tieghemostelium lacteum]|eukprot:KYQ88248.1 guanine deaminase [Tieghemostelium lacteum]